MSAPTKALKQGARRRGIPLRAFVRGILTGLLPVSGRLTNAANAWSERKALSVSR